MSYTIELGEGMTTQVPEHHITANLPRPIIGGVAFLSYVSERKGEKFSSLCFDCSNHLVIPRA